MPTTFDFAQINRTTGKQQTNLPVGAEIVTVDVEGGNIRLWYSRIWDGIDVRQKVRTFDVYDPLVTNLVNDEDGRVFVGLVEDVTGDLLLVTENTESTLPDQFVP